MDGHSQSGDRKINIVDGATHLVSPIGLSLQTQSCTTQTVFDSLHLLWVHVARWLLILARLISALLLVPALQQRFRMPVGLL